MTRIASIVAALAVTVTTVVACDQLTTVAPPDGDVFDAPVEGLSGAELAAFARGDAEFARPFSPNAGLGPIFNDVSCAACHSGDGRGQLRNALLRIGDPSNDFLRGIGGPQIQTQAITGALAEPIPGGGVSVSVRLPPPVFGVGLIEAIPVAEILANVDSLDADGDGISGRPNWVLAGSFVPPTEPMGRSPDAPAGYILGRFGRKAQNGVLLQQAVEAYLQDMGITSPFLPLENRNPLSGIPVEAMDKVPDPEVLESTVQAVTHYMRALAPPAAAPDTPERLEGRELFMQLQCGRCHVPELTTGTSPLAAVRNRTVAAYSDFLLHDMGPGLADNRPDGQASGSEWRTTPLWGLRLMRQFLDGQALLLHDGRARTIQEAIELHGGEALASRNAFVALTPAQKSKLLDFVGSR